MTGPSTVVIGAGSPLMGDDGVGVAAVELLRRAVGTVDGVSMVDGGTWGMQLLPDIEDAERLLVLDAIRDGREPGTVVRLEKDDLPRLLHQKMSPHQIDLQEVFALAELRGRFPSVAVALGVEPEVVELRDGLSPAVARALPELLDAALLQLRAWGHDVGQPGWEALLA
ncbi:MAG: HyaD/HybD family hydrogenase maturation endopeptidase [Gemmatimonadetes bacterium]|nr:HyaD/HybD family hydrogenase maturation endopeptidase [Gemmatimonadota bacterium]